MWALFYLSIAGMAAAGQYHQQHPVAVFYQYNNQMVPQPVPAEQKSKDLPCSMAGFFPHPTICDRFYRCVDFIGSGTVFSTYEFVCPVGMTFVAQGKNTCVPGNCPGGSSVAIPQVVPQIQPGNPGVVQPVNPGMGQPMPVAQPAVTYPPPVVAGVGPSATQPGNVGALPEGGQQGGIGSQPGGPGSQQGGIGSQPGGLGSQQGGFGSQPGAGNQQPSVTYPPEVVPIGGGQPGAFGSQPGAVGAQPGAVGTQPGAVGAQPGAVGTQPGAVGTQPGATGTQQGGFGPAVTYPPQVVPIPGLPSSGVGAAQPGGGVGVVQPGAGVGAAQPGSGVGAVQPGDGSQSGGTGTGGSSANDGFIPSGGAYPQPGGVASDDPFAAGGQGGAAGGSGSAPSPAVGANPGCRANYQQDAVYCNVYHSCPDNGNRYMCTQGSAFNEAQQLCDLDKRETLCAGKQFKDANSLRTASSLVFGGFYPAPYSQFGAPNQLRSNVYQYQQPFQASSFVYNTHSQQPLSYQSRPANPLYYYTALG